MNWRRFIFTLGYSKNFRSGQSLVSVLVAMGVGSIVALSIASLMSEQNKRVQFISEKLLTKEIESQLKSVFSNADYCNCAFRGKRFDTTAGTEAIVATDQFLNLPNGYSTGPLNSTPCNAIA